MPGSGFSAQGCPERSMLHSNHRTNERLSKQPPQTRARPPGTLPAASGASTGSQPPEPPQENKSHTLAAVMGTLIGVLAAPLSHLHLSPLSDSNTQPVWAN